MILRRALFAAAVVAALGPGAAQPAPADHDVELADRDRARVGQDRALSLTIAPRPGYAISRDGPLVISLAVAPDAGVEIPKKRYALGDAADARADAPRFDLRYRAGAPGAYTLRVSMRFWVCGRHTCRPVRHRRAVHIEVTAPPPDP